MKIAVLGSAPSSVHLAPFRNQAHAEWVQGKVASVAQAHAQIGGEFEIWACSPGAWAVVPRATRWFEVHRWEPGREWFSPEYCQFLRDFRGPVYTGGRVPEIPNHVVYPIDRLEEKFSSYFMTSSLALMMALAIDTIEQIRDQREIWRKQKSGEATTGLTISEGMSRDTFDAELDKTNDDDVIGLWGVDMAATEEYCVAPETKVLTADLRWVPVSEIEVGDELVGFDEEAGGKENYRSWRLAIAERVQRLTRPCYRIYLADGTTIVASQEHRWLTFAEHENRWQTTDQLVTSAHRQGRPTRIVKLADMWEENRSRAAGYLAAAFDGEGHFVQSARTECNGAQNILGFSQRDNAMSKEVELRCEELGFSLKRAGVHKGPNGDCVKYRIAGGRPEILRFLGSVRPHRLLEKFSPENLGVVHRLDAVAVERIEPLGECEVIGLGTSTRTFVAEGFASHNSFQRPGCQFFVLEALRRGIGVYVPPESDLMRPMPVYGIAEWDHNYIKLTSKAREINQRQKMVAAQMEEAKNNLAGIQGEMAALNTFVQTWTNPYGMQHGMVLRQVPGTGMGSGITSFDGRPVERMHIAEPAVDDFEPVVDQAPKADGVVAAPAPATRRKVKRRR